jgi:ribosomal protein L18
MLAKLVQAYHLKLFFSNNLIKAEILDKIRQECVASACSNNKWIIKRLQEEGGPYANKNDERAAAVVGEVLATKALRKQVGHIVCS